MARRLHFPSFRRLDALDFTVSDFQRAGKMDLQATCYNEKTEDPKNPRFDQQRLQKLHNERIIHTRCQRQCHEWRQHGRRKDLQRFRLTLCLPLRCLLSPFVIQYDTISQLSSTGTIRTSPGSMDSSYEKQNQAYPRTIILESKASSKFDRCEIQG